MHSELDGGDRRSLEVGVVQTSDPRLVLVGTDLVELDIQAEVVSEVPLVVGDVLCPQRLELRLLEQDGRAGVDGGRQCPVLDVEVRSLEQEVVRFGDDVLQSRKGENEVRHRGVEEPPLVSGEGHLLQPSVRRRAEDERGQRPGVQRAHTELVGREGWVQRIGRQVHRDRTDLDLAHNLVLEAVHIDGKSHWRHCQERATHRLNGVVPPKGNEDVSLDDPLGVEVDRVVGHLVGEGCAELVPRGSLGPCDLLLPQLGGGEDDCAGVGGVGRREAVVRVDLLSSKKSMAAVPVPSGSAW